MEAEDLIIDEFYIYEDQNSHMICQYVGVMNMDNDEKLWYKFIIISNGNNYYRVDKSFCVRTPKFITPITKL